MKKFCAVIFSSIMLVWGFTQGSGCADIVAGPDQTLPCNQTCTDISADVFEVGETDTYAVTSIPHAPPIPYNAGGGNAVSVNTDDVWSSVINLPFPFCFFDDTYTSCVIGSNGTINFNTANAGGYSPWPFSAPIPSAALTDAGNIFGIYHDIDPSVSGSVRWFLRGLAPCRTFIVVYENIGYFDCTGGSFRANHMMVLYETTNIIEVYAQNKPTCTGWNSGNSVIGIQNPTGTQGFTPPGRNTGSWTINTPEAWQFTPDGAPIYSPIEWFNGSTLVGTGPTINVCPPSGETTYTARTIYERCDGLQIPVEDELVIDYETVEIDVTPENVFTCAGSTVTLSAISSSANTFTWSPGGLTGPTVDVSPSAPTSYTVIGTNTTNGCSDTAIANITFAQPVNSGCNVLYVTPTGLPSNDGTKASPLDLETALELGACNGTVVKMAIGDYITDTVINKVTSFITLEGGFDPTINWDKISTAGATRILRTAVQSYSTGSSSLVLGSGILNEAGLNPEVVAIQVNNQSGFRFQDITIENQLTNPGTQYAGYQGVDMIGVRLNSCADYNIIRTQVISDDASPGANRAFTIPATNGGNSRGIEINTNGANGVVNNSNVSAGTGGAGGTGPPNGTNGTSSPIFLTGTALATNNTNFNLVAQPTIQMDDISCTATNMDYNSAVSNSWNFGVGSAPNTGTGTTITTQYATIGRKTISYGVNNYLGFANIILDDQALPAFDINTPIVLGEHRICVGESISASATNGGVGYIYNWTITNNNTGFIASFTTTDENTGLIQVDTTGFYTVELRYETSCCGLSAPTTKDFYVEDVPEPVMPTDESFCFGVPGGVTLSVGGLTPNGTIQWQPTTGLNVSDSTTVVALPNTTTTYTTTLTDSTGLCSSVDSVEVEVIDLVLTPNTTPASCTTLGTAGVSVTGGSGDYNYNWSTGANTQNINGLQPGNYSVVVTDNTLGCLDSIVVNILPQAGTLVASSSDIDANCLGANNGEITVSLEGGTAPFTYNWSHLGAAITKVDTFDTQTNLAPGIYTIDITDNGGCTFTVTDTISEPPLIIFALDSVSNPICVGVDNGFIGIVPDGGIRPYTFTWNNGMTVNFVNDEITETNLAPDTYTLTLTDAVGCIDSVSVSLTATLITDTLRDTICFGDIYPLVSGGSIVLTRDTLFIDSLLNPIGCDSVLYSFVEVLAEKVGNINTTLCAGDSIIVNGTVYNSSVTGAIEVFTVGAQNCDSTVTINIEVLPITIVNIDTTICDGETLTVNGISYTTSGIYQDTARYTATGCDSIQYVIDLEVNTPLAEVITATICQGDEYIVNGVSYTTSVTNTLDTAFYSNGCDSILYDITLTVNSLNTIDIDTTICVGDSYTYNGSTYTTTGTYTDTLFGGSVVVPKEISGTNLPVTQVSSTAYGWGRPSLYSNYTAAGAAIPDGSLNGFSYTSLTDPFWTGSGNVINSIVNTLGVWDATVPDNQWFGASFAISVPVTSTYYVMLAGDNRFRFSLDGVVQITSDGALIVAGGQPAGAGGAGTISFTKLHIYPIEITQGCHIITIEGLNEGGIGMFGGAILDNTPADIASATSNTDLNYVFSTATATEFYSGAPTFSCPLNGIPLGPTDCDECQIIECDTIVTINLTVDSFVVQNIDTTLCQGESVTVNGVNYIANGFYQDTARYTASNCDSIQFNITLRIDSFITENYTDTICEGDTYSVHGFSYTSQGVYNDTLQHVSGCDSIVFTVNLTVDSVQVETYNPIICQRETFTIHGNTYTNTGLFNDTLSYATSGCDSIVFSVNLTIDSFTTENYTETICQGENYSVHGFSYNSSGIFNDTLRHTSGCDSIVFTLNLSVDSFETETYADTICVGDTYTINGFNYNTTGIFNDTIRHTSGCDSIVFTVNLQVDDVAVENYTPIICQGETYTVHGFTYNATGVYNDTLRHQSGCDSIVFEVDLTINPLPNITATISPNDTVCVGDAVTLIGNGAQTYIWNNGAIQNGVSFAAPAGTSTYQVVGTDANGCIDSTSINLFAYPTFNQSETVTICEDESYTLPNGTVVNTAGNYTSALQTVNGCDSIINTTLNVNFLLVYTPLTDIRVCSGLGVELITNAQNTVNITWFVSENGVQQSLVGNPNYTNTTSDGLGFNLDTALHENVYIIEMTDECGNVTRDSMLLEVFIPQPVANGLADTTFCLHEIDVVTVDYNGTNYEWNTGELGASILPDEPGEYIVNFVENYTNCLLSDTINIAFEDCIGNCVVLAPTGFSPNGDGSNDEFRAVTSCDEGFSYFELRVFNRWGELIFSTDDWQEGWDGSYKGREAEIGTYMYYVEYTKNVSNEQGSLKGNVSLIR